MVLEYESVRGYQKMSEEMTGEVWGVWLDIKMGVEVVLEPKMKIEE